MANDQTTDAQSSGVANMEAISEDSGEWSKIHEWPKIHEWQPVNDIERLHRSEIQAKDAASVQFFNGNPKLLNNFARRPSNPLSPSSSSNPGNVENNINTLLSNAEEPLVPTYTKARPTATSKMGLRSSGKTPASVEVAQKKTRQLLEEAKMKIAEVGKPTETKGYKPEKTRSEEPEKKINHVPDTPIIWQKGDGSGSSKGLWKEFHDYGQYKMDATNAKSVKNTFPPANVLLSDWWVGRIAQSALGRRERGEMWPCDFTSKGDIRASRTPKGRAYKQQFGINEDGQKWFYVLLYRRVQLHGKEGLDAGRSALRRTNSKDKKIVARGDIAIIQNDNIPSITSWTPHAAERGNKEVKDVKTGTQEPKTHYGAANTTSRKRKREKHESIEIE